MPVGRAVVRAVARVPGPVGAGLPGAGWRGAADWGQDARPSRWTRSMPDLAALQAAARHALRNAHAPYSQLRVGAAVLSTSGAVYLGCNVENAAFPAGGCAEHHAIAAAVLAEGPGLVIERVEVAALDPGGHEVNIPPCGGCRQRIKEFGPDAIVGFRGPGGVRVEATLDELLPHGFSF